MVVISHVPSQRSVLQPTDSLIEIAYRQGAAGLVDVCQALGHVPIPEGADACVGTSRKWLHGPRGVGLVVLPTELWDSLDGPPTQQTHRTRGGSVERLAGALALEPSEAAVAARLGFAHALEELHAIGLRTVRGRLRELGGELRESLAGLSDMARTRASRRTDCTRDAPGTRLDLRRRGRPTPAGRGNRRRRRSGGAGARSSGERLASLPGPRSDDGRHRAHPRSPRFHRQLRAHATARLRRRRVRPRGCTNTSPRRDLCGRHPLGAHPTCSNGEHSGRRLVGHARSGQLRDRPAGARRRGVT